MPSDPEERARPELQRSASPRIAERLFDHRTVLLFGAVTMELAERVSAQRAAASAAPQPTSRSRRVR